MWVKIKLSYILHPEQVLLVNNIVVLISVICTSGIKISSEYNFFLVEI